MRVLNADPVSYTHLNVKEVEQYIDRIDEMIGRKEKLLGRRE